MKTRHKHGTNTAQTRHKAHSVKWSRSCRTSAVKCTLKVSGSARTVASMGAGVRASANAVLSTVAAVTPGVSQNSAGPPNPAMVALCESQSQEGAEEGNITHSIIDTSTGRAEN